MNPYDTESWSDLFVAGAGASAALTGLVFVALSINLQRILAGPGLSSRAGGAIAVLTEALVICLAGLVPQPIEALATELLIVGIVGGVVGVRSMRQREVVPGGPTRSQMLGQAGLMALPSLAIVIGAVSLWLGAGGGLSWVAGALVLLMLNGILNAWVLLVEIQR